MEQQFEAEARLEPEERAQPHWLVAAISVTTAALAVLAAYSSLLAGQSAHHSLAELNRAAILQALASDQWNFYQAEGIKRHVFEVQRDALGVQAGPAAALAATYQTEIGRYRAQQAQIRKQAERLERERDQVEAVSQQYDTRYQQLALAVALIQIGIVVSSVASIVRRAPLWYLGLAGGAVGAFFLLKAMLMPIAEVRGG